MKTLVAVNCLQDIAAEVYASHCQFWGSTLRTYPNDRFMFYSPSRLSIDRMRNTAAMAAMEHECDYLMFIDDDMIIHPQTFTSLVDANADIVAAITLIRGYPFNPMVFSFEVDAAGNETLKPDLKIPYEIPSVYSCDAVGFACVLIKVDKLKKLKPPYFVTGPHNTEDIYFCMKMQDYFGRTGVSIVVDTRVPTSHCVGRQFISVQDKPKWLKFAEVVEGAKEEKTEAFEPKRSPKYVDEVLEVKRVVPQEA